MKLSVVIVNYNVKYFLEQCLHAVRKACNEIESEVFVVDNNSVDGSVTMVNEKFPEVILIKNKENKGFSKANNQAIKASKGKYILLLNPDTVVEDNTFRKVIDFMDSHPDAGGLGVKMVNGKGKYLPESKRGLPTPAVAFYKIFGLSGLFPKSKIFGKYHLGYLDKDEIHKIDVLAGAFMLLRKEALDKVGLLDESFFMYGEDIDLSYRLTKGGYVNYYYPKTRIIHYKGECTKKSSINYVFMFYNAMIIFAKKHFSQKNAKIFSLLIKTAIYLRAFVAIIRRFIQKIFLPILDVLTIFLGIYFLKNYWETNIIFHKGGHYPSVFISFVVPFYIVIWLLSVYLSGGYDRPIRLSKIFQGLIIGTVTILLIYALLDESYRFSRALIILGSIWAFISMLIIRFIFNLFNIKIFKIASNKNNRYAIIGEKEETERVANLLIQTNINPDFIGLISVNEEVSKSNGFIGNITQIKEIVEIYKIDEIVFCAKDIPAEIIINQMSELQNAQICYKIAPPESLYIIGSNSINSSDDLYTINSISKINNKRNKLLLDFSFSFIFLIISPFTIFLIKKPLGYYKNIFSVFMAKKTWVGYHNINTVEKLPVIKKGVLNTTDALDNQNITSEVSHKMNVLYARNYKFTHDINIILKGFKNLGRT